MATIQIPPTEWQDYFDRVAELTRGKQVYVEVAGLGFGSQVGSEWMALNGISYDPHNEGHL